MTKYNYEEAAKDKVLGWFWCGEKQGKTIGFLTKHDPNDDSFPFRCSLSLVGNFSDNCYERFEFYDSETAKKYELAEPEYIPFSSAKELVDSEFWGKTVRLMNSENYRMLDSVSDAYPPDKYWFDHYETLDSRRIGKLKQD